MFEGVGIEAVAACLVQERPAQPALGKRKKHRAYTARQTLGQSEHLALGTAEEWGSREMCDIHVIVQNRLGAASVAMRRPDFQSGLLTWPARGLLTWPAQVACTSGLLTWPDWKSGLRVAMRRPDFQSGLLTWPAHVACSRGLLKWPAQVAGLEIRPTGCDA